MWLVALAGGSEPPAGACEDGLVCVLMGTGELGFNGDGQPGRWARLATPTSVLATSDGSPMVVDFSNMRLRRLDDANFIRTVVGDGRHAYSEIGANRLATPLENPVDAAWGPDGLLYVLPMHEGRVVRVGEDDAIELWAGTGVVADAADDCPASVAEMGFGGGLAFAEDGTLYVSDNTYNKVRRVSTDLVVTTVLGNDDSVGEPPGYGPDIGLRSPERLVVDDARRRLLVADTLENRVLALDEDTLAVEVLAGTGERGFAGDGGPALDAELDGPVGLAVAPDGTVLVSDLGNDVVRAVFPDGTIDTVLGTPGEDLYPRQSAPPLEFPITGPAGLAWSDDGDLWIAERGGDRMLAWNAALDAL